MRIVEPGALTYPALCFSQGLVEVASTSNDLVTCTKVALKNGYFNDLLVIDSEGWSHRVRRAEKVRGVGRFWGYNVFLNQRIQVRLYADDEIVQLSVDQTRDNALKSARSWQHWEASGDLDELRRRIVRAVSHREIAMIVSSHLAGPKS